MISDVKKKLLDNPESLKNVLEKLDYHNVIIHDKYISFGREKESSKKSIVIRLVNNDYLYVNDYAKNINTDLFKYICEQKQINFSDIMKVINSEFGFYFNYSYVIKKGIFGGIYDNIKKNKEFIQPKIYDENNLRYFEVVPNKRFIKDHICVSTQKKYGIGYDVDYQCITIPIRNQTGGLIGVKARCNYDVLDGEQKYYYILPCQASKTLFGFYENYEYLSENKIYVFEAEKSVMQCDSYGIRNTVALMSGSLSIYQAKMINESHPKEVIFMHDTGYPIESILRNISILKSYSIFSDFKIGYWNYFNKNYQEKISPSDKGKKFLENAINNEIKYVNGELYE